MQDSRISWLAVLLPLGLGLGCQEAGHPTQTRIEQVQAQFRQDVLALDSAAVLLKETVNHADVPAQQAAFRRARLAWKRVEWLTEYYFPATAKAINGAAVPEYEESDAKTIQPEGFQVVEPLLFPEPSAETRRELIDQTAVLRSNVSRLKAVAQQNPTTDAHLFDALRLEVFRVVSMGITGFDSPVAKFSIPEAKAAIQAIRRNYAFYEEAVQDKKKPVADSLRLIFDRAEADLRTTDNKDEFNNFDRLAFITNVANPLSSLLYEAQLALDIMPFQESRGLRAGARTLFEADAFDVNHYIPGPDHRTTPERIALGRRLFYDPVLSGDGRRACASCHLPDRAFTDGLTRQVSLDGHKPILRNTPTLQNVGLQRSLFADSRVAFLEDQATDVVTNTDEMHGSFIAITDRLKNDATYNRLFSKIYTDGVTSFNIRNAIASYERSLVGLNSRFDQYVRGAKSALNEREIQGFNLFVGKGKCATCHFLPLLNGTVPPHFEKTESENLGVPEKVVWKGAQLDPDLGRALQTGAAIHRHFFKTPTVRNVALTAPYMHNGAFETLDDVVEFYDRGGGRGLGIDVENQTLAPDKLNLSPREKADLVAFMKALTDISAQ